MNWWRRARLEELLVNVPSPAMTLGSRILGIALLAFGLTLLVLVLVGFTGSLKERMTSRHSGWLRNAP